MASTIRRVINGGGIPQKNETLNRVYANVLNKPVLVPEGDVTSLGSAIMAFMAAGAFESIEAAQQALCPRYRTIEPDARRSRGVRATLCAVPEAVFRVRQAGVGGGGDRRCAAGVAKLAAQVRQEDRHDA